MPILMVGSVYMTILAGTWATFSILWQVYIVLIPILYDWQGIYKDDDCLGF